MKAAEAVSSIAARESSRAAQDWDLGTRLSSLNSTVVDQRKQLDTLLLKIDRMDVTLAKVADWTVAAPGRGRGTRAGVDPVSAFIDRTRSDLPPVPTYLTESEAQDAGVAIPAGPTGREPR
jgi:hypothetical protein